MPARLVIVDDHQVMAEGLARLLAPRFAVAGVVRSAAELLELLARELPDIILLDISMPDQNGLDLLPRLRRDHPGVKVVMLTMHVDRTLAETAMNAGASGFVTKECDFGELVHALEEAVAGRTYVTPRMPKHAVSMSLDAAHPALSKLTAHQHEVLRLIALGLTSAQMAGELGVAERTISYHRANLRHALGIPNEWALVRFAVLMRAGTAPPEVPAPEA